MFNSGNSKPVHYLKTVSIFATAMFFLQLYSCTSYSPLQKSARDGNLDEVRSMIESGKNVNEQDEHGVTPLMLAAQNNHPAIVSFLLANGANPSLAEEYGNTALHYAKQCVECAKSIVDKGGIVDAANKNGATPLIFAASVGSHDVAKYLLKAGANINAMSKGGLTPLLFAAISIDSINIIEVLLRAGGDIEQKDSIERLTPLFHAALQGNTNVSSFLLAAGADKCVTDTSGKPLLEVIGEKITTGVWQNVAKGININSSVISMGIDAAFAAAELRKKMKPVIQLLESYKAPENSDEAKKCKAASRQQLQADESYKDFEDKNDTTSLEINTSDSVSNQLVNSVQPINDAIDACLPPCRSGFICYQGTCVSKCNPPCPAGFSCSDAGECEPQLSPSAEFSASDSENNEQESDSPEIEEDQAAIDSNDIRKYKGFFFEFRPIGFGLARSTIKYEGGKTILQSPMISTMGFSVGGAPVRNLTIYASIELGIPLAQQDTVELKAGQYTIKDSIYCMYGFFGGGIRYYFPYQFFIGVEGGFMAGPDFGSDDYNDARYNDDWYATIHSKTTGPSFGARFDVGKEWWLGTKWSIGVGFNVAVGSENLGSYTYTRSWPNTTIALHPEMQNITMAAQLRIGRH
jgi:ankyrin repeat protein